MPGAPPPPPGDPGPDGSNKRPLAIVGGIVTVVAIIVVVIVLLTRGDDEQVATAPTTAPTEATTDTPPATAAADPTTTLADTTTTSPEPTTTVDTTTTVAETTTTFEATTTTVPDGGLLPVDCPDGTVSPGGETLFGSFDADAGATVCLDVGEAMFAQVRVEADDDTTLTMFLDGEEIAFDDDTYGLDPAIRRPLQPGVYVLAVQTYGSFGGGMVDFELTTMAVPVTDDGCESGLVLGVGGEVDGLVDNDLGRVACLVVEAPGVHEVRVEADTDTSLAVFRDGEQIDFDDDTYGLDPAVTREFEPGVYLLVVSNYSLGISDNFFSLRAN